MSKKFLVLFASLAIVTTPMFSLAASPAIGPQAALDFSNKYGKNVIPLTDLHNMKLMNQNLYTPDQILKDFERNKKPGQIGAVVIIVTQACHANSKLCANTISWFEKMGDPQLVSKYAVYIVQVMPEDDRTKEDLEKIPWKKAVKSIYQFEQGPGAKIVVLAPGAGQVAVTDAQKLEMYNIQFQKDPSSPKAKAFLDDAAKKIQQRQKLIEEIMRKIKERQGSSPPISSSDFKPFSEILQAAYLIEYNLEQLIDKDKFDTHLQFGQAKDGSIRLVGTICPKGVGPQPKCFTVDLPVDQIKDQLPKIIENAGQANANPTSNKEDINKIPPKPATLDRLRQLEEENSRLRQQQQ